MAERKIFRFESIVLLDMTLKEEGYHPDSLGKSSAKFIFATCRYCGEPSRIRKGFYTKAGSACHRHCKIKEQSEAGSPFARSEVQAKRALTNIARYGVMHPTQRSDIANKISITKRNRCKSRLVSSKSIETVATNKNEEDKNNLLQIVKKIADPIGLTVERTDEFDIYVPLRKFCVCLHSDYFCSEAYLDYKTARKRHIEMSRKAEGIGCRLLHLYEGLWNCRRRQVESLIKNAIGANQDKIAARKCYINKDSVKCFIDENHIQGPTHQVDSWFNLVFDGEIVSSMTASRHHRQNIEGHPVVLSRFCSKSGCNVQGGASKLFERLKDWAIRRSYDRILSWSDNSYAMGGMYRQLGFMLKNEYPPDYFYWDMRNNKYVSKQSQRKKNVDCPDGLTESEWAVQRGLYRIWDCGKKLWVYEF